MFVAGSEPTLHSSYTVVLLSEHLAVAPHMALTEELLDALARDFLAAKAV
jgi:hypothetical protein